MGKVTYLIMSKLLYIVYDRAYSEKLKLKLCSEGGWRGFWL